MLDLLQPIGIASLGGCLDDTTNGGGSDSIRTRGTDSDGRSGNDSETVEVFFAGDGPRDVTLTVTAGDDERFSETRTLADGDVWRSGAVPSEAGTYVVRVDVADGPSDGITWSKSRNTPAMVVARVDAGGVDLSVGRHTVLGPDGPPRC